MKSSGTWPMKSEIPHCKSIRDTALLRCSMPALMSSGLQLVTSSAMPW